MDSLQKLIDFIKLESTVGVSDSVKKIVSNITLDANVLSILYYGSGLWKQEEDDTVFDFYVLVNRYKDINMGAFQRVLNAVMPPNVYYKEISDEQKTLRFKYAVIRIDQFSWASKGYATTPQIWARFAQPSRLIYSRDNKTKQKIHESLAECVLTFHRKTLPLVSKNASPEDIWIKGLSATYGAELRSENPERTKELFQSAQESFKTRTSLSLPLLNHIRRESKIVPILNHVKTPLQKIITFLRLCKATLTFDGGVDYALWKIGRHSGVHLKATQFQKKYPLIAAWPLVLALWRKGAFR